MTIQGQIFIQITEHNLIEIKIYIQNTRNKNNVWRFMRPEHHIYEW